MKPSYFVWRPDLASPFKALGTRNHFLPPADDGRCIWRGDDYVEARRVAREANRARHRVKDVAAAAANGRDKGGYRCDVPVL